MKNLLMATAAAALLVSVPAFAQTGGGAGGQAGGQGLDQQVSPGQNVDEQGGATTSGPGVKGFPDTRTGPATRVPGDEESGAATGAGAGTSGTEHTTVPSQDSSGVQGFPNTRTGPATRAPGEEQDKGVGRQTPE